MELASHCAYSTRSTSTRHGSSRLRPSGGVQRLLEMYDLYSRDYLAKPEGVGEDFTLILEAFAEAFRGLSPSSRLESRWSKLRHGCESF